MEKPKIETPDLSASEVDRPTATLTRLRAATAAAHTQLEQQLDAIAGFADPRRRSDLIQRFAAFHIPAESVLGPCLSYIPELGVARRRRAALFPPANQDRPLPSFPAPANAAEALGMLYVLEGSTLGGRMILRALADAGADVSDLAFLDPYGSEAGKQWRGFLAVLERETAGAESRIADACKGAAAAFEHAHSVLCGVPA